MCSVPNDFTESSASDHGPLKEGAYNWFMASCTGGANRKRTKGNQATFFHFSLLPFLLPNNRSDPMRSGYLFVSGSNWYSGTLLFRTPPEVETPVYSYKTSSRFRFACLANRFRILRLLPCR